mgnify:CR=1 FL=1
MTYNSTISPSSRKSISVFPYAIFAPFSASDFTGKELDEETGYGYFGARYMDHELMTGWLSVDPMADKYPSISPYSYCAWNPVKLVDPDGREVYINGDGADQAVKQLSNRRLSITRDLETGKLTYSISQNAKINQREKELIKAISSENVKINIYATNNSIYKIDDYPLDNNTLCGMFMGTSVSDCDNNGRIVSAETYQVVNPNICENRDKYFSVPKGTSLIHEITESYQAGLLSIEKGISYGPSYSNVNGKYIPPNKDHIYGDAHKQATPQARDYSPVFQQKIKNFWNLFR